MIDLFGEESIKALSWKQPYGTAMLHGKDETRSWKTSYRGLVLICTTKAPYKIKDMDVMTGKHLKAKMYDAMNKDTKTTNLHGYAIAIGRLVECRPMKKSDEDTCFVKYKKPWIVIRKNKQGKEIKKEKRLWVHIYKDVKLIKPFPFKGAQGWKKVSKAIRDQIKLVA